MKGHAIGIDMGTRNVRAVCIQDGSVKAISTREREDGQDMSALLTTLREDAEVFLKKFVSSCVVALPVQASSAQREEVSKAANASGFEETRILPGPVMAALSSGRRGRLLVFDFGASATLSVVDCEGGRAGTVLESAEEPGSLEFDPILAAWLRERLLLPQMKEGDPRWRTLLREAEKVKIALSDCAAFLWTPPAELRALPEMTVEREELERLIRFPIRRLIHTARRLWKCYAPERLLLVGGASRTPLLQNILRQEMERPELLTLGAENAVARGAALCAAEERGENAERRLQELKRSLSDIELLLTREQQNRLKLLFSRFGEDFSQPRMQELAEDLARDLKRAVA